MKGDFSKDNFDKSKQYTSVRMQQGRVQLDSDWNEQIDIFNHRIQVENTDFIGGSGTPIGNQGYNITLTTDKKNFNISQGRYYVNGVLAESPKVASYTTQPDWPKAVLPTTAGLYLAYLDLWQRGVSAIEDPSIREVALSGTDTTTRVKNVTQVKLVKLATDPTGINLSCNTVINNTTSNKTIWDNTKAASTGQMTINVSSAANFSNQLYRVEIHDGGSESQATFKWSRDNGSVLASISKIDGDVLTFKSLHTQESDLEFKASQWVELNTRTRELHGKPGIFVQLLRVDNNTATVTSWPTLLDGKATTKTALATEFSTEGTMRRWDSVKTFVLKSNTASFLAISNFKKTGSNITLDLPSANNTSTFTVGEFVELRENISVPGVFVRLKSVSGTTLTLESGYLFNNAPTHIRAAGTAATTVSNTNNFVALEEGLEIKFSTGTYKTGDYWLIPTRATSIAEWPKTNNQFVVQRAKGIHHNYAPLSLLRLAANNTWTIVGDCRTVFSPLINRGVQVDTGANSASVVIDTKSNVGIGTSTPKNKLDVEGNAAIGTTYSGTNIAPANGLIVEGNVGIGTTAPKNKLDIEGAVTIGNSYSGSSTAPANGLLVEGKVGIGTSSPDPKALLHVEQSGSSERLASFRSTNDDVSVEVRSDATTPNEVYYEVTYGSSVSQRESWKIGTNNDSKLNFAHGVQGSMDSQERMSIATNGNVGIGTTTPKNKLDVEGNATIGSGYSGSSTAPANGLIVEGNVGIGTNSPAAGNKLEIKGKTQTDSLQVGTGPNAMNIGTANNTSTVTLGGFLKAALFDALFSKNVVNITNQVEFDAEFGNGTEKTIPANRTIILNPIEGSRNVNTYNGRPAYRLRNTVTLSSNVTILGFNEETTIVTKESGDFKFKIIGSSAINLTTNIKLSGWTFDGYGGAKIDPTNVSSLGLTGTWLGTDNGGAFFLSYCKDIELNCKIVNHKTTGDGGAIYGFISGSKSTATGITAERIYNCSGKNGGGVHQCDDSTLTVYNCQATDTGGSQGGGCYFCNNSTITVRNCEAKFGGGAYSCGNSTITAYRCKNLASGGSGGGASGCNYSTITAHNCTTVGNGGGANACNKSTIFAYQCTADIGGGAYECLGGSTIKAYNCTATTSGGGVAGCLDASIDAMECRSKQGAGVQGCHNSTIMVSQCRATSSGGGAYSCNNSTIRAVSCRAIDGAGAANCNRCTIIADGCTATSKGGGAYLSEYCTITACNCTATTSGGGAHACKKMVAVGNWFGNGALGGTANISNPDNSYDYMGVFAIGNTSVDTRTFVSGNLN